MKTIGFFLFLILANGLKAQECATFQATNWIKAQKPEVKMALAQRQSLKRSDFIDREGMLVIPLVVHVMTVESPYAVTDSQVHAQVNVLNETYGRYGLGYNSDPLSEETGIRFCLASINPDGYATTGITREEYAKGFTFKYPTDEESLKLNTTWNSAHYLNVWLVDKIGLEGQTSGSLEGYAYYPPGVAETSLDGIVLDMNRLGIGGNADADSEGKTLTHEIGHYLDLYHTWGDESDCNGTDFIEDTPPCLDPVFDCAPIIQCNNEFRLIHNYMDYTPDDCQNMFTKGQIMRMRDAIFRFRPNLVSSENLLRTGCTNWADSLSTTLEVLVYPNPTSSGAVAVKVAGNEPGIIKVDVFDDRGRQVRAKESLVEVQGPFVLDLRGLRSGLYYFRIESGGKTFFKKVLFQN